MNIPRKISSYTAEIETEYSRPSVYARRALDSGSERLVVDVSDGRVEVFSGLIKCLEGPFLMLYVLHTPRGEGAAGRYQSPKLSRAVLDQFIARFSEYFQADGRFDIWIRSQASNATLVWDRHNKIFAYGPLVLFEATLNALGFSQGEPESAPSTPHIHHYRSEYDNDASAVLAALDWQYSPLRPEDEQ